MNSSFSDAFRRALSARSAWVAAQLQVFNEFMPPGEWSVDLERGVHVQSGRAIQIGVLGSYAIDGTWLWGWAHEWLPNRELAADAWRLRRIGERAGIPELTLDLLDLGGFPDPRLAAETLAYAGMGILGALGYLGVTSSERGRLYLISRDPAVPRATEL